MSDLEKILAKFKEKELSVSRNVLEEIIKNKMLTRCPLCKSKIQNKDNFGQGFENNNNHVEAYCSSCNYIIELEAIIYWGRDTYYDLFLIINTNAKYSDELARVIIETQNGTVQLNY